jgi:uncharacterized protein YaiL (DUF2058 family)
MTRTRYQIHERLSDLSGEWKAACENKRLTEGSKADAEKALALAVQADEKAQSHIDRLTQEAEDLKAEYAQSVDELIQGLTQPEPVNVFNSEFYNSSLENGAAKVERAFNEATN